MPLKTIILNCAAEIGLNLTNLDDLAWLKVKINEAAEDLYTSDDLTGCLREQVFTFDIDDQQISLPWYIYKLRGARWSQIKMPIRLDDLRPRYATLGYNEMLWRGFTWRIKDDKSALAKDISNAAPLTFTIPAPEPTFTINVTGTTANSNRLTEEINFSSTDTTKTAINSFTAIKSITKNIQTVNDITITDVNGNVLAILPNSEFSTSYTIVQIIDFNQTNMINQGCNCIEILYKTKFIPFKGDYDTFPCGDQYDQCIFYKFMEIFRGKQGDQTGTALYKAKCNELVGNLAVDTELGKDLRMDFGKNRFLAAQNKGLTDIRYRKWNAWNVRPNY